MPYCRFIGSLRVEEMCRCRQKAGSSLTLGMTKIKADQLWRFRLLQFPLNVVIVPGR